MIVNIPNIYYGGMFIMNNTVNCANWLKPNFDVIREVFNKCGKTFVNWKGAKIPCNINGYTKIDVWGNQVGKDDEGFSHENPMFWSNLDDAIAACDNPNINGIGIRLNKAFNLVCIDLDEIEDVTTDLRVKALMDLFPSYTEISTSGHGIHIFVNGTKGDVVECKKKINLAGFTNQKIEVYDRDHYIIITGHIISETREIRNCQENLDKLLDQFKPKVQVKTEDNTTHSTVTPKPRKKELSSDDVLNKLLKVKRVSCLVTLDKDKFKDEFGTSVESSDESSIDMTLMNYIVCFTKDVDKIKEVFKKTGWYEYRLNTKPDKILRDDYLDRTVTSALEFVAEHPYFFIIDEDIKTLVYSITGGQLTDSKFTDYLFDKAIFEKIACMSDMGKKFIRYDDNLGCWDFRKADVSIVKRIVLNEIERLLAIIYDEYNNFEQIEPITRYLVSKMNQKGSTMLMNWIKEDNRLIKDKGMFDVYNKNAYFINFADKKYDIKTDTLVPLDYNDYASKVCYIHTNGKNTGKFIQYIDQFFDPERKKFFMQAIGASLIGELVEKAVFFLYGPANTGKSTLMDVLGEALGSTERDGRSTSSGYFKNLSNSFMTNSKQGGNNEELVNLKGCRIARISEMSSDDKVFNAFIKNFSGNNTIHGAKKYESEVEFSNSATLWVETNEMPKTRNEADEAYFKRVYIIKCTHEIDPKNINKNLRNELLEDEGGIAQFLMDCCREYQKNGLIETDTIKRDREEYKDESSYTRMFIKDCCVITGDQKEDFILVNEFYSKYKQYFTDNGFNIVTTSLKLKNYIKVAYQSEGVAIKNTHRNNIGGEYYLGIRFKTSDDYAIEPDDEGNEDEGNADEVNIGWMDNPDI